MSDNQTSGGITIHVGPAKLQMLQLAGAAMSDTPRTDAAKLACGFQAVPDYFLAHARDLERENAALRADKERLEWIETNARLTRKVGYLRWSFEGPECGTVRGSIDIARGKEAQP